MVATKAGRRLDPHVAEGYDRENLERFVDRSRDDRLAAVEEIYDEHVREHVHHRW